jgi:RHS repeat-associated protein
MKHPEYKAKSTDAVIASTTPAPAAPATMAAAPGTVEQAKEGLTKNVKDVSDKVGKASDAIAKFKDGKAGVLETGMAVKGAVDAVKGGVAKASESLMLPIMTKLAAFKGSAVLPAGKQMDPVLGIDVHMVIFPPVPAPVPLPHPYIGMLFKPKDFVSIAINTFKKDIVDTASSFASDNLGDAGKSAANNAVLKDTVFSVVMAVSGMSASVKFGGFIPRAVAGTPSKNIPHFPMGPAFHPAFMVAIKKNHGKAFLGSLFVAADGDPMVGMFHLHYDCWDIGIIDLFKTMRAGNKKDPEASGPQLELVVPSGTVMAIPWGRPVLVNSIPTPFNPLGLVNKLFKGALGKLKAAAKKSTQKALDKLTGKVPCNILTKVSKMAGTGQSHPVDVSGGFFYTDNEDFALPGPIPLVWERTWYNNSTYQGPLGHGWHHSYDMALGFDKETNSAILRLADGRAATFDIPVNVSEPTYCRKEKMHLHLHEDGFYYITDADNLVYRFTEKIFTKAGTIEEQQKISSIANHNGFAIRFEYNRHGSLEKIIDSASRVLRVENNVEGNITAIYAPHPTDADKTFAIAQYQYDAAGDMVAHIDALNQAETFSYSNHLMVQEVWRNGLTWQFRYDGVNHKSKCIEVIGDNDLLHYHFDYTNPTCTKVTNSLGHEKLFYHKDGLVTKYVDPNGQPWQYYYNKNGELEHNSSPTNQQTAFTHDAIGNIATVTEPDGLFNHTLYLNKKFKHLPSYATDERGGQWQWQYDEQGNLVKRINPLGATTQFVYKDGLLHSIKDAIGATTILEYDKQYNVQSITAPNAAITRYEYDKLGQCIAITNPNSARQVRTFDILGRTIAVKDFDGNNIALKYDALDNVINYKDKHKDVDYSYTGIKKLQSRTEGDATLTFTYDTEEQLKKITNQQNLPYTFTLDPAGNVITETGFDGLQRNYIRNAAGLTTKVERPGERYTAYQYDAGDRITQVTYHDGTTENYSYNQGALATATNADAEVIFDRDIMGNVTTETCNGHSITSKLDILQRRTNIASSLGADIALEMDMLDNITSMKTTGWAATMQYDSLGLETAKELTGGIKSQWQRDAIGRVKSHSIGKNQATLSHKDYSWDVGDQLKKITDSKKGTTNYEYDKWGNLSSAAYADGTQQLRCPDAVGNLYQQQDRKDRKYDRGGKLLQTKTATYNYDTEGNLVEKITSEGNFYYFWNAAGMLAKVIRPDKTEVFFKYDALGRRIEKQYKKTITKYVWDCDKPLHEWKEFDTKDCEVDDIITWIFEEDSFAPTAKIKGNKKYSIVTDHLGTPTQGYNETGDVIWDRELDSYGKIKMLKGDEGFCNYLYQGQTLDVETGLAYNRFRYYAAEEGIYISKDRIGLEGGDKLYGYVMDTNGWIDPLGLASYQKKNGQFGKKRGRPRKTKRKDRKTQYPSGYKAGVVEKVIAKNTRDGVIYDKNGRAIARKDVTIEHNTPVVEHWNNGGNNMSRKERSDAFNDTRNMSILSKQENSSGGGSMTQTYTQVTGPNYSN